jgi:preprotein translocase subunit YajC
MFISKAYAAAEAVAPAVTEAATNATTNAVALAPTPGESFMQTMIFTLVLVILFYFLLIRPQQKRFKEHSNMLTALGKGDKIITQGGLVGNIEQIKSDQEMIVDFGNNIKLTVMRTSILGRYDDSVKPTAANDDKKSKKESA